MPNVSYHFNIDLPVLRTSLVALFVKKLPAVQEMEVWFLGWDDPLEKGMATHSSIFAWEIPWTKEPEGYSPWGRKESDMTEAAAAARVIEIVCFWVYHLTGFTKACYALVLMELMEL